MLLSMTQLTSVSKDTLSKSLSSSLHSILLAHGSLQDMGIDKAPHARTSASTCKSDNNNNVNITIENSLSLMEDICITKYLILEFYTATLINRDLLIFVVQRL